MRGSAGIQASSPLDFRSKRIGPRYLIIFEAKFFLGNTVTRMRFAEEESTIAADTPEARRYNRIRRWLEISDFALGFVFLVALLFTGWRCVLRDWAYWSAFQNYQFSVFVYVFLLMLAGKLLGLGLDYYGLRLERRYNLSNQKTRAWLWDE